MLYREASKNGGVKIDSRILCYIRKKPRIMASKKTSEFFSTVQNYGYLASRMWSRMASNLVSTPIWFKNRLSLDYEALEVGVEENKRIRKVNKLIILSIFF